MTNTIIISDITIHQDTEGRFSLNDLHKAAGRDDKHQPAFFMRRNETIEMIGEISNSANMQNYIPVVSRAGRYGGTYVCKELVYAYAMWISAAFALKVIRAYDALVSGDPKKAEAIAKTTVDDRTPLRGIVNRIMGKYGMTYQAVYKLVHKEFGVNHIDELTPKQTAEAIEYLATKAIEGEFLGKQPDPASFDFEMYVHNANVVCIHLEYIRQVWKQELHPALRLIGSPLAVKLYDRIIDAGAISYGIRHGLEKASGLKGLQH